MNTQSIARSTFIIILIIFSSKTFAQNKEYKIEPIPYKLEVINDPTAYLISDTLIEISAKGKTNLFNNPNGIYRLQNAAMVLFEPTNDFTFKAKVSGDLKNIYDVATLVIYQDENTWAKLCYENSVEKIPTIVSVVTRTYSDDCNSMSTGLYAYLAVVKKGQEFLFFYSQDNKRWLMIRHFRFEDISKLKIGFAAHGSRGDGFTARFTEIKYTDKALDDMRDF